MTVNIGKRTYQYGFRYEPDWEPESGVLLFTRRVAKGRETVKERYVHGRTMCRIQEVVRDPVCPLHAGPSMAVKVECTCAHPSAVEGYAYCSISEKRYDRQVGQKLAFAKAVQAMFPNRSWRAEMWHHYLTTVNQVVHVQRVMAAKFAPVGHGRVRAGVVVRRAVAADLG